MAGGSVGFCVALMLMILRFSFVGHLSKMARNSAVSCSSCSRLTVLSTYQNQSFPSFDCGICLANRNYTFANTEVWQKDKLILYPQKRVCPLTSYKNIVLSKHYYHLHNYTFIPVTVIKTQKFPYLTNSNPQNFTLWSSGL